MQVKTGGRDNLYWNTGTEEKQFLSEEQFMRS